MIATIKIIGFFSQIIGEPGAVLPSKALREVTSYAIKGAEWSPAYRNGSWDGRKQLMKGKFQFPTGLLPAVKEVLEQADFEVVIEDLRIKPKIAEAGFDLIGASFDYPYDYQLEACHKMVAAERGIVKMATGAGKGSVGVAVAKHLGVKTLFVVPSQELLYQMQQRFMKHLGCPEEDIGLIGDGHWNPSDWITVATVDTLASRINSKECTELLKSIELLFVDEMHEAGADGLYSVISNCGAYYKFGLSATPTFRTDGANLRLYGAFGDTIVDISNKVLVDRGVIARADVIWDKITEPVLRKDKKLAYPAVYKEGVSQNQQLLEKVVQWTKVFRDEGLSVLILCEEIAHGKAIDEALWTHDALQGDFIPHQFVHGEETSEIRQAALAQFSARELPVLIGSTIYDVGIDCHAIDAMILAGSRKSKIRTLQRLGRGLRGQKLIAVEFSNFCHKYLLAHSYERLNDYKNEECFPIYYSGPDASLVKKLWNK